MKQIILFKFLLVFYENKISFYILFIKFIIVVNIIRRNQKYSLEKLILFINSIIT